MTGIIVAVIVIAASFAAGMAVAAFKRKPKDEKRPPSARVESSEEAHYMRNFWSYDGSEQEDYDE